MTTLPSWTDPGYRAVVELRPWDKANTDGDAFVKAPFDLLGLTVCQDESSTTDYYIGIFDSDSETTSALALMNAIAILFVPAGDQSGKAWTPPLRMRRGLVLQAWTALAAASATGTAAAPTGLIVEITRGEVLER